MKKTMGLHHLGIRGPRSPIRSSGCIGTASSPRAVKTHQENRKTLETTSLHIPDLFFYPVIHLNVFTL